MTASILILGGTSGIGVALARRFAARGARLVLAGRREHALQDQAVDLRVRGAAGVTVQGYDAAEVASLPGLFERALADLDGELDGVVLAHGVLIDGPSEPLDLDEIRRVVDVNFTSAVALLELAAAYFEPRGRGWIVGVSSVAGDRGRQSNYWYGSTKAGLTALLSGLRNRLAPAGVHVLTVEPGFVDTPMLQGRPGATSPLVASPDRVAGDILRALDRRRDVLYTPWFWRWIMAGVGAIPEPWFKRMRL